MKALIDADIFQWEFGNGTDSEGVIQPWPFIQARVQSRISGIMEATGADSYQLYLTSDDKSNFRYEVATIQPYKGNRKGKEKPHYYQQIRNFLKDHRGAIEVHGMEADDALAIEQYKDYSVVKSACNTGDWEDHRSGFMYESEIASTVICSRDKDLNMVPGYHYSWGAGNKIKEKEMWWTDELTGLRSFYKQLLTGDSTDNIPGLFGVGKSSKLINRVDDAASELECYDVVFPEYLKRFGSYAEQFIIENGRLLWMLEHKDQRWLPPSDRMDICTNTTVQ
jgi:hypothetical protein